MAEQKLIYVDSPTGEKVSIDSNELFLLRSLYNHRIRSGSSPMSYLDIEKRFSGKVNEPIQVCRGLVKKGLMYRSLEPFYDPRPDRKMNVLIPWLIGDTPSVRTALAENSRREIGKTSSYGIRKDVLKIIAPYTKLSV